MNEKRIEKINPDDQRQTKYEQPNEKRIEKINPDDQRQTKYEQPNEKQFWFFLDKIQSHLVPEKECDLVFTTKIAVLAIEGTISEAELYACLESLWRAKKRDGVNSPVGYFRASIQNTLKLNNAEFSSLLSRTPVPAFA